MRYVVIAMLCVMLDGCGVAALPCRVTAAAVDVVPGIGHPVAQPFNGCAAAIDPGG